MQMVGWVKCLSPQNSVAAKSNTIVVNGDQFLKCKKKLKNYPCVIAAPEEDIIGIFIFGWTIPLNQHYATLF